MKHFTIEELCNSATAKNLGIWNWPIDNYVFDNLNALVDNVLDPAREELGAPIYVNSGYRSKELNVAVGGASRSQHLNGEAADIHASDMKKLFNILRKMDYDQLIVYYKRGKMNFFHVSYVNHRDNRHQFIVISR